MVVDHYVIPGQGPQVTTTEEIIEGETVIEERVVREEVVGQQVVEESAAVHLATLFFKL